MWEEVIRKDLKEISTSWEGVNNETLDSLVQRRIKSSPVGFRRFGTAVRC